MIKTCEICQTEFNAHTVTNRFCGPKCFHIHRKGMPLKKRGITKNCEKCGGEFYVPQVHKSARFCSMKCRGRLGCVSTRIISCGHCGKNFGYTGVKNKTYCSNSCCACACAIRKRARKEGYQFETVPRNCEHCGKEFQMKKCHAYKTRFCSRQCRISARPFPNNRHGVRRAAIRRGVPMDKCELCGYCDHPEILTMHHKDLNPRNNKRENLIPVCPNCHSLEHQRPLIHPPGNRK